MDRVRHKSGRLQFQNTLDVEKETIIESSCHNWVWQNKKEELSTDRTNCPNNYNDKVRRRMQRSRTKDCNWGVGGMISQLQSKYAGVLRVHDFWDAGHKDPTAETEDVAKPGDRSAQSADRVWGDTLQAAYLLGWKRQAADAPGLAPGQFSIRAQQQKGRSHGRLSCSRE